MTELSPAAKAVLTAVTLTKYDVPPEGLPAFAEEMAPLIAAALRAAVVQALPKVSTSADRAAFSPILAIAAELEAPLKP